MYPFIIVTRGACGAAIRNLPEDEKHALLGELWDALDHDAPQPERHEMDLDRRLDTADAAPLAPWSEARERILGST